MNRFVLRCLGEAWTMQGSGPEEVAPIQNPAVAVQEGRILWIGPERELPEALGAWPAFSGAGGALVPGLIDSHTHLCFGGDRLDEFRLRLQGLSYQQIAAQGGGIRRTVAQTRVATEEELLLRTRRFLDRMMRFGVTTVEAKTGYGLDLETERKQLAIYAALRQSHPVELHVSFLAHLVPDDYAERRDRYLAYLCQELMPELAQTAQVRFVDVFCEEGAFSPEEARLLLMAGRALGWGIKLHADQFRDSGGARLAAELGAVSADHLEHTSPEGFRALAEAGVVATFLPGCSFYLRQPYASARQALEAGVTIAIATDFNPGSSPTYSLPFVMSLACVEMGLSPEAVWVAVTRAAAQAIGQAHRIGRLAPGYEADLVLLDHPSPAYVLYHGGDMPVRAVWKRGQLLYGQLDPVC
ncbi:MAG: imidazolonepropionase [Bacteroidota bacterium]|nr:imidazolonepropionase [Bacteroidota bacterium]MDW8136926.1 imidazolonepropionase [Bacteroidota bacterium]